MKLLVGGDSFGTRYMVDKSWGDYVNEHYQFDEYKNCAVSGISNRHLIQRTIEHYDNYKPDITLVILTSASRDYRTDVSSDLKTFTTPPEQPINSYTSEEFIENYISQIEKLQNYIPNLLIMQGVAFNAYGKYAAFDKIKNYIQPGKEVKKILEEQYVNFELQKHRIDKNRFINIPHPNAERDGISHYITKNDMIIPDDGHPNEEGHKWIAQRFIDELDKKNLFQT